jgi:hypothetical protein
MGMKMAEQPFMMRPGILSIPTDFEGFGLLIALQSSAPETGAMDRNLRDGESRLSNSSYEFD